jgi:hypothetical protein
MKIQSFYRAAVWLPLLVPAVAAIAVYIAGWPQNSVARKALQIVLISGVYGGLPYALLAVYGTWWIGDRSEAEIRKRAILAPLFMIAVWVPVALLAGILYKRVDTFVGLLMLGTAFILSLGYAYVGMVLLLRTKFQLHDDARGRGVARCHKAW